MIYVFVFELGRLVEELAEVFCDLNFVVVFGRDYVLQQHADVMDDLLVASKE